MPERAVAQLGNVVIGEQDLSEKWLFISFYNTEKMRDTQLNYQAKGFCSKEQKPVYFICT